MLRPSAAVGTRIAIGEGPQIAEAYLFRPCSTEHLSCFEGKQAQMM
jgi:hypothetical protein